MSKTIDFLKQSDAEIIAAMNARDRDRETLGSWNKCFDEADKETAKHISAICGIARALSYKYDIGYREIMDDMVLPFFEVEG